MMVESDSMSTSTIDFENQVEILTEGYLYLQDNACTVTSIEENEVQDESILPYTMIESGSKVRHNLEKNNIWEIFSVDGQKIKSGEANEIVIDMTNGLYIIRSGQQSQLFTVF